MTPLSGTGTVQPVEVESHGADRHPVWARVVGYELLPRAGFLALLLAAWEWFGRGVDPVFFSYPSAILAALPGMVRSGELPGAVSASLQSLYLGFLLAAAAGVTLGCLMGRYRLLYLLLDWEVTAVYATPYTALVPLFILWFGLGLKAKVAMVFLPAFFPILINTLDGVRGVDRQYVDVARAEGASEWQVFTKIILPGAVPSIMTGIRLGIGRGVVGMVVAEMFTAITGLGGAILYYGNQFRTDKMLVAIVTLSVLATVLTSVARVLESRVARWRDLERS